MSDPTPSTYRPDELERMHRAMIDELAADAKLDDPRVLDAFRAVRRHLFLPGADAAAVYRNDAVLTHADEHGRPLSSSTQPSLMAMMIDQLDLKPGHRVLEIGTATGYNAAILRHIVGDDGLVVTVDIDEHLVLSAREHLAAAGYPDVRAFTVDGGHGWPELAPYDRILVTVGSFDIPPAWRRQLAPGGRLVVPLAIFNNQQRSIALEERDGYLESVSHVNCGFLTMRGEFAATQREPVTIGDVPQVLVVPELADPASIDCEAFESILRSEPLELETEVAVQERELVFRLFSRFSLHVPNMFLLVTGDEAFSDRSLPRLLERPGQSMAVGAYADGGIGVVVHAAGWTPSETHADRASEPPVIPLAVRAYGENQQPAYALLNEIRAWDQLGRPAEESDLRIRIWPAGTEIAAGEREIVIEKPCSVVVVSVGV